MSESMLSDELGHYSEIEKAAPVRLNRGLITLLSEQLYKSPLKAVEELVVNSFDADATECRIGIASPTDLLSLEAGFIAVYDNGKGMDATGLVDLWHVGSSPKNDPDYRKRFTRRMIGKFGIGKLASYAVAHRLTYLTHHNHIIRTVSMDFREFTKTDAPDVKDLELPILRIKDWRSVLLLDRLKRVLELAKIREIDLAEPSWTIALLEDLKPKAAEMKPGRLRWVLSTAMPLTSDFALYLNGDPVTSAKEDYTKAIEFDISELPADRLKNLQDSTQRPWKHDAGKLVTESFPGGITGRAYITERSLRGKSDDLQRSYGFFIRVRGRLVNLDDPLFGMDPLSHEFFNSFRADINADDLHAYLLSSREEFESAEVVSDLRAALRQIFNEARQRKTNHDQSLFKQEERKPEEKRSYIEPRLIPRPLADVLADPARNRRGSEATNEWFYLRLPEGLQLSDTLKMLYSDDQGPFQYSYEPMGTNRRMVSFDVVTRRLVLNEDHQLVRAYQDEGRARRVLEDFVTAEVLLEVYLREAVIEPQIIGDILERRDSLLRGLARDHAVSLSAIATELRDGAARERDLEVALVRAARGLGFVATQVSGGGEPDGVARWIDYKGARERKITLEAKSSADVPSLGAIDSAGIADHMQKHQAEGCIVVAPSYPGDSRGNNSSIAVRAQRDRFSCWTAEDLARVVENAERRHITADDVLAIVTTTFTPSDVKAAVDKLLSDPSGDRRELARVILEELRRLQGKILGSIRSVDMLIGRLVDHSEFVTIDKDTVKKVLSQMSGASKGAIELQNDNILILTSLDELETRLADLLGGSNLSRGRGAFRADNKGEEHGGSHD